MRWGPPSQGHLPPDLPPTHSKGSSQSGTFWGVHSASPPPTTTVCSSRAATHTAACGCAAGRVTRSPAGATQQSRHPELLAVAPLAVSPAPPPPPAYVWRGKNRKRLVA